MKKSTSRFRLMAAGLVAAAAVMAGSMPSAAEEMTKVTLCVPVTTIQTLSSYYSSIPMELYWKEEGLDVNVVGLPGANVALQALESKQVDVVAGTNSALFSLLNKIPEAGLKAYFTHTSVFHSMPMVAEDSPLQTIADMSGKKIGVQTLANSQVPMTKALLGQTGGDPDSMTFLPVGEGIEAAHALETGSVDVLALYDGLYAAIEAEGMKLRELKSDFVDRDKVGFNAALIVRQDDIDNNREMLVKIARGVAKAVLFAQTSPENAVRIHWKHFPATKPRGMSEEEALTLSLRPLEARLKNVTAPEGLFGNSTDTQIEGYMNLLLAGGVLDKPIAVSQVWDPSMLKDANDFDHEAVKKQAMEWSE